MGMYDYLDGEQVKIFYTPVFNEKYGMWHSGGSLRNYSINDELPLKTTYYKYPDNMIIYAYGYCGDVWIVKDKILKEHYSNLNNIKIIDLSIPVYDYMGNELNINTVEDFILCNNDYEVAFNNKDYDNFKSKWFAEDKFKDVKCLGELLECYYYARASKDWEWEFIDYKKKYTECRNAIRRYIEGNPGVIERYFEWHRDSVEEGRLRYVINEVLREKQ